MIPSLLLIALSCLTAIPLAAHQAAESHSIQLNSGQMLAVASDLIRQGRDLEAHQILELLARDPNPEVRNEARYRLSQLMKTAERYEEAAVLMRRILDDKPEAASVRLELATVLHKMGREEAALHELRAVRTSNLPLNVARFVDRLSASLQSTKPIGVQFEIAMAPDSNINRGTRSDTLGTVIGDFTFQEDAQAKSGIGAALRGLAHARISIASNIDFDTRISGDANLYRHEDFNDITLDVATGPEWSFGSARISAEAGITQQWYGMSSYQRSVRLAASLVRSLNPVSQVRFDGGARWTDNSFNNLQDGSGWSARARYDRALSPRLSILASIGIDRFEAEDPAYSTRSWGASLTAYREIGRMTTSIAAEVGRLRANDRLFLLPEARRDRLIRLQLGSVFRHLTFKGFAPMTRLVIERNRSTVEFYDYRRVKTEFGLTRAF